MNRNVFLSQMQRRPLICDGAMGTQLFLAGLLPGACGEAWNVHHADRIQAVHRAYLDAGCDMVTTNTFGASRASLSRHGLDAETGAINRAAAELARKVAGDDVIVLGDIGPLGQFLEPLGELTPEEAQEYFLQQAQTLHDGGADGLIIETMADADEMAAAVAGGREAADWPVIATYAFEGNLRTIMGVSVESAIMAAIDAGADVVGANCGTGLDLDGYARLAEKLVAAAGNVPVILQPNAGNPELCHGSTHYTATPSDMAALVEKLIDAGVRIIGGCCGTTPAHIEAMAGAVRKSSAL